MLFEAKLAEKARIERSAAATRKKMEQARRQHAIPEALALGHGLIRLLSKWLLFALL